MQVPEHGVLDRGERDGACLPLIESRQVTHIGAASVDMRGGGGGEPGGGLLLPDVLLGVEVVPVH